MKILLAAGWLASLHTPLIRDGAVVFDERQILSVGPVKAMREAHPDALVEDAGEAIILPGLVNPHTHLELSDCTPGTPPKDGFVGWLKDVILRNAVDPAILANRVEAAITAGVQQCLRFGVTTVGDISRHTHLTRPILRQSPLRVVSFGEVQAMAGRRNLLDERLTRAIDPSHASDRLRIALSPHAPYSIEEPGYRRCIQIARERGLPLATHLAESADETAFLADHTGPFRELWTMIGGWDDQVPTFSGGPIRFAQSIGLLDYPTLLAHVNYCDDDELAILAAGKASVIYNPRTHAYFGHHPHRWRDMLRAGINVAVGTDSCASSPDLNLVDEIRLLRRLAPEAAPEHLWQLITIRAAKALMQDEQVGSIRPGKSPDFAIFPVRTTCPLMELLERDTLPSQVWVAGRLILPV